MRGGTDVQVIPETTDPEKIYRVVHSEDNWKRCGKKIKLKQSAEVKIQKEM